MKKQIEMKMWFALVAMVLLMAIGGSASIAWAAPSGLPPRPAPNPTPAPPAREPRGGWIELRAQEINRPGILSVVQWEDSQGEWHDVESWRGGFDEVAYGMGKKTWWVGQELFGLGPFRWAIYDQASNEVLARSASFTMPTEHRQTVGVDAVLP